MTEVGNNRANSLRREPVLIQVKKTAADPLDGPHLDGLLKEFRAAMSLEETHVVNFVYITKNGFDADRCRAPNIAGCKSHSEWTQRVGKLGVQFFIATPTAGAGVHSHSVGPAADRKRPKHSH